MKVGYKHIEEDKRKMRDRVRTKEHREAISQALTGRKLSKEHRRNIGLGQNHTEEMNRQKSERQLGQKRSMATRRNIRESLLGNQYCLGHKWTKERREAMSGENHWNWQGGISFDPYPPSFSSALKESILERDCHECVICSNVESEINHVHHIDYDKKKSDPTNLITLCSSCHSAVGIDRDYWQTYFTEFMKNR